MAPPSKPPKDLVARGVKGPSPLGTTTFIGLRALDPVIQYQLLAHGLGASFLANFGIATIPLSAAVITRTGIKLIDRLGLPLERLLLVGMAIGSAAKQIFWLTAVSEEEFRTKSAVAVSAYNTFCNSINSLLFLAAATSASRSTQPFTVPVPGLQARLSLPVALGALLYVVGIALETASEVQRKSFKKDPSHKGKLCRVGLWSWARHINYTGYTLWRTGYALAAGGWIAGSAVALLQAANFARGGTVNLDFYMSKKYKDQWGRYKEDVPYKLFPGIY